MHTYTQMRAYSKHKCRDTHTVTYIHTSMHRYKQADIQTYIVLTYIHTYIDHRSMHTYMHTYPQADRHTFVRACTCIFLRNIQYNDPAVWTWFPSDVRFEGKFCSSWHDLVSGQWLGEIGASCLLLHAVNSFCFYLRLQHAGRKMKNQGIITG